MLAVPISLAFAAMLALSLATAGTVAARDYRLGPGDVVRVKVYEWPDLTGEFRVGPSGNVFLTLIGQVPAEGFTPAELSNQIGNRLQAAANLQLIPSTTVEIIQFRPFFVTGHVQTPGEYAYRPGLTALRAVSIAGGFYRRAEDAFQRLERDSVLARGRLRVLAAKLYRLQARKARLDAELKDHDKIDFPPSLLSHADDAAAQALLKEERLMLTAFRRSFRDKGETLDRARAFLEEEIKARRSEIALTTELRQSADKELADVRSLVQRGLAPTPRQLALERVVAGLAVQIMALETAILRARHGISQHEQSKLDLLSQRDERILKDSQATHAEIEETLEEMETAKALVHEAEVSAPVLLKHRLAEDKVETTYVLTTEAGDEVVDESVPIPPGAVLRVERSLRQPAARAEIAK